MRHIISLCILSLLFSALCTAKTYTCTFDGDSGNFYDLSPLSLCRSEYSTDSSDGNFVLNICQQTSGCGGAGVCQNGQFNCGNAGNAQFNEISGGVSLTYNGGDGCPNNQQRKSVFTIICDNNAQKPVLNFTSENPMCVYNFHIRTKEACPKPKAPQQQMCYTKVFIVPHTHDDVGWLQTIDGYYSSQVKHIIDTSLAALVANPSRKFIYVEQAFFTRWWYDTATSDQQRNQMKTVVQNGQWEFVLGGWVMPDEAATTYGAVIDQLTLGHQFIKNTFGVNPSKGWQIDPFGASSVTPVIYSLAGFDAHIIDRITNKDYYQNNRRLNFMWRGSPTLGDKAEIFTEIMGGGGYCDWFEAFNFNNDPVNPGNVADYGNKFANFANGRTLWYLTTNILAEWGCDFQFQNAAPAFDSMDKVVNWLQQNVENTGLVVEYATLSEYFDSVNEDAKNFSISWPLDDGGDYFNYFASLWWTGYFTSRVELKGFVRRGEGVSHVVEPIFSIGRTIFNFDYKLAYNQIYTLRVANGDAQHHDGVTGTSVPEVVQMYKDDLINGMSNALTAGSTVLNLLLKKNQNFASPNLASGTAQVLNIQAGQVYALVLFNSLGWIRSDIIDIPINNNAVQVLDNTGSPVPSQIIPAVGGNVTSKYLLFFQAQNIPPLGYYTYFVVGTKSAEGFDIRGKVLDEDINIENSVLSVNISSATGRISSITNKKSGLTVTVDQNLCSYISYKSGAYAFTPAGPAVPLSAPTTVTHQGPLFTEVYQTYSLGKQSIRLYNAGGNSDIENFIDLRFDVGPLPSHVELVTRFSTSIGNGNAFSTDANGFQFLQRKYEWSTDIGSNFYPMVYGAYIQDAMSQLSLISERSHGVSSVDEGLLEVMIHRNPDMGDGFGPGLTDTTEVYPSLRAIYDTPANSPRIIHKQSYLMNYPIIMYSAPTASPTSWNNLYISKLQMLTAELPENIHLQAVNALDDTSSQVIIRLVHLYARGEDAVLSNPAEVDFSTLFVGVKISAISETTVSANKVLSSSPMKVTIYPSEIRTFVVTLTK